MLIDAGYSQFLLKGLFALRQNEELCDVELRVGNASVFAHKVVLAALSDYFKVMFTTNMLESERKVIELNGLDEKSLNLLVNFAYTGNVNITVSNVQPLLVCANMLRVSKIVHECCEFLEKQLHYSNCLGFLQFASLYCLESFKTMCLNFIAENFTKLLNYDEYYNINKCTLKEIISNNNLNVSKEEYVFEFLERWVAFDKENRIMDFCELFKEIRCSQLSQFYLKSLKSHYLFSNLEISNIYSIHLTINSLLSMKLNPYRLLDEDLGNIQFPRRNSDGIIVIGGKDGVTQPLSSCHFYNIENDTWRECVSLPEPRHYMSATSLNGTVFVTGGVLSSDNSCTSSVLSLSTIQKTWEELPEMIEKRYSHSSVAYDGLLYILGGYNGSTCLKTVECYDPKTCEWTTLPSMMFRRSTLEAVVLEGCIYALGGRDKSYTSSVEKLDIISKKWEMVPAMNYKRISFGAVAVHGYIFVVGGHDGKEYLQSMERFDPVTSEWTVVSSMPSVRSGIGVSAIKNKIYVFGGHNGTKYLDSALKYDPVNDFWSELGNMTNARCYMAITDVWKNSS